MAFRNFAKLVDVKVREGVAALTGVETAAWPDLKNSLVEHGRSTRARLQKGVQQVPADATRFEEIEQDGREQLIEEAGQALNNAEFAAVNVLLDVQNRVIQVVLQVEANVADAIESFTDDCATSHAAESTAADEADAPTDSVKVEVTGSELQATDVSEASEQLSEAPSEQLPDQPSEQ